MHVLCVAEKPSIAKSVSQILSGGQFATVSQRIPKKHMFDFLPVTQ
jgi:DNA topoisomerase III